MDITAQAAIAQAGLAFAQANKDTRPFIAKDYSRFYMLHGTLTNTAITTTASTTYTSLTRPFIASKQIKFTLNSTNNGVLTVSYSLDGVTFTSKTVTLTQDPVSSKYTYEQIVAGPVLSAFYKYVETASAGSIYGGIISQESVVV
ncbi:hypothetical protein ACFSGI_08945 [Paenibacillus nicotianae]|uniref:Uncharacterized protein n=1 Tax=Paenibacillus nicotianae TaxID=1526551 RepID=A0ABW4URC3_9BACL